MTFSVVDFRFLFKQLVFPMFNNLEQLSVSNPGSGFIGGCKEVGI